MPERGRKPEQAVSSGRIAEGVAHTPSRAFFGSARRVSAISDEIRQGELRPSKLDAGLGVGRASPRRARRSAEHTRTRYASAVASFHGRGDASRASSFSIEPRQTARTSARHVETVRTSLRVRPGRIAGGRSWRGDDGRPKRTRSQRIFSATSIDGALVKVKSSRRGMRRIHAGFFPACSRGARSAHRSVSR